MLSRTFVRLSLATGIATLALGQAACTSCYTKPKTSPPPRPVVVEPPAPQPVPPPVVVVDQPVVQPAPVVVQTGSPGVTLSPEVAVNPVRTQHVMVATVRDQNGNPMPGMAIEWMLTGDGAIVDVDGGGKTDNGYASSRTASSGYVLDRGNADPSDDVQIGPGQTWAVITSAAEGTSNVIAYAPDISNWDHHKAFATKNWMDVTWEWPVDATNRVGTPHTFTTRVMRYSDGTPLVGYYVNYEIIGGPPASFQGGGKTVNMKSDSSGVASATLVQSGAQVGTNDVEISIVRPANAACCIPEKHIISGVVRKTWVKPEITCTKSGPAMVTEGDSITYNIAVTNPSNMDANSVTVTDYLPNNVRYVSSSPSGSASGNTINWNLGTVGAGQTVNVSVTGTAMSPGVAQNRAKVTAENGALQHDCEATTQIEKKRLPNISIRCECPNQVLVCDPIIWRCTVTNNGDGAAQDVVVRCTDSGGISCSPAEHFIGTLGPGESRSFESNCTASSAGTVSRNCTVTSSNANSDSATCSTTVVQPALSITKSSSRQEWKLGRPITWDIQVSSTGSVAAKDVILTDLVPAGTTFKSASDGGSLQGGQVVWNLGTLNPGESRRVSMVTTANSEGTIRNTATARAYCAADVSADATVSVRGVPAILLECIDVDDPIEVGGTETYVIDVTNQGNADDHNIVIEVTLPPEQEYVSAEGARGASHSVSGKVVRFAPVPTLEPKGRLTYRVIVKAIGEGDVRLAVSLTAESTTAGPVRETESTHQY